MNKELLKENKILRQNRPITTKDVLYSTYENNGVYQIFFRSRGCSNYLNGSCIMCDYGKGTNLAPKEVEIAFDRAMSENKSEIHILFFNTYGSILDESEFSEECFEVLLKKIKNTDVKNIIFETHYTTITEKKIKKISEALPDKVISFEFGFESSNPEIRENNLLKFIDNDAFKKVINLVHSFKMEVIVNILVGIPFLSTKEQFKEALSSIDWCIKNKVDEIDLFPVNIKPYNLLYKFYEEGRYKIISHWLLIEILNNIPLKDLDKIYIAWYGNRELIYTDGEKSIFPSACSICSEKVMKFYESFLVDNKANNRKSLIKNLINEATCNCYFNILKELR